MQYIKRLGHSLSFVIAIFTGLTTSVHAADTSLISDAPTSAISLLDNETYDFEGRTIDGSAITDDGLFRCFNRRGVTIKNVTVTGSPRYALFARGCSSFTIENFTMLDNPDSVGGIRFDQGTENLSVTISGISATNQGGHALELWDVNGFTIEDIYAQDTEKCGLLVNRSRNGSIGRVTGIRNSQYDYGYATMRFANNAGPNLYVEKVYSRDSGRGLFTVSGSNGIEVNTVDIFRATIQGIYIQGSDDVTVNKGRVGLSGADNCLISSDSTNVSLGSVDCDASS